MTSFHKPVLSTKPLLWLGFGKLAREFAQIKASSDYQLYALCRSEKPDYSGFSPTFANVNQPETYRSLLAMDAVNVVITLTPEARTDEAYRCGYVEPIEALCHFIEREQLAPERIVFVSSTSVYGQNDGQWVNETSAADASRFSGVRLREAEDRLMSACPQAICLRFSGIYGAGRNRLIQQVLADAESACGSDAQISMGNAFTNRIHQRDCARVINHLLSLDTPHRCYIATDSCPVTKAAVLQYIADRMALPLVYDATEQASAKQLSNRRLLDSGFEFEYPSFKEGYCDALAEFVSANGDRLAALRKRI